MCTSVLKALAFMVAPLAAACFSISPATAQTRPPIVEKCGATIESQVATANEVAQIKSSNFVTLRRVEFFRPLGVAGDCVVILFTAETACSGTPGIDRCYIQALHNGVPMRPRGSGNHVFDSESLRPSSHAFAWVTRGLLRGLNTFTIQVRVGDRGTVFVLDEWTMQVQLLS